MYGDPNEDLLVPVGEDQESHVELGREIVRRFNILYGLGIDDSLLNSDNKQSLEKLSADFPDQGIPDESSRTREYYLELFRASSIEIGIKNFFAKAGKEGRFFSYGEVLREPSAMLTLTPRVPGTDGRKMSKSYNNFISLSESDDSIRSKVRAMVTDPARKRRQDPGNPDVCPVFDWHKLFPDMQTPEKRARIDRVSVECRTAAIGCVECKGLMADALIEWIAPVRARREQYAANPGEVLGLLDRGSGKARGVARNTMSRVRESIFGWEKLRASLATSPQATDAPSAVSDVTGTGSTWSPRSKGG